MLEVMKTTHKMATRNNFLLHEGIQLVVLVFQAFDFMFFSRYLFRVRSYAVLFSPLLHRIKRLLDSS